MKAITIDCNYICLVLGSSDEGGPDRVADNLMTAGWKDEKRLTRTPTDLSVERLLHNSPTNEAPADLSARRHREVGHSEVLKSHRDESIELGNLCVLQRSKSPRRDFELDARRWYDDASQRDSGSESDSTLRRFKSNYCNLPHEVDVRGPGKGVWAVAVIGRGTRFGPFLGKWTTSDSVDPLYSWEVSVYV